MITINELAHEILSLSELLVVLLAQPDAETAIDGMHAVAKIIHDRAAEIHRLDEMAQRNVLRASPAHTAHKNAGRRT